MNPKFVSCLQRALVLAMALHTASTALAQVAASETVYRLDLNDPAIRSSLQAQGARVVNEGRDGKPCIRIDVPAPAVGGIPGKLVSVPLNLGDWSGSKIAVTASVRAENVTKPFHTYTGVKVQVYAEASDGEKKWIDTSGLFGSFDWQGVTARGILPAESQHGALKLGVEESSGTVWISDVRIECVQRAKSKLSTTSTDAPAQDYYQLNLNDPGVRARLQAQGAQVVNDGPEGAPCVRIDVPASDDPRKLNKFLTLTGLVDAASLSGCQVAVSALVRGADISKPGHSYTGVKLMFIAETLSGEKKTLDYGGAYGTFEWKELAVRGVIPADATKGTLLLALQESSGTVWFSNVKISVVRTRKTAAVSTENPTAFKAVTTLRGVMGPNKFKQKDFDDMAAWKVNLVRWHMQGVKWKPQTYEQWLQEHLDDLALVLDASQKLGIKVVVTLMDTPGGRRADGTQELFFDKKWQDQFVQVWEGIARRFKDHPALWAYDLINEPVQNQDSPKGVDDWLGIQLRAARAIRAIDPKTAITIEVDQWDSPESFQLLEPVDIPNVIYQVHMYWPGEFTHQGVHTDQGIAKDKNSVVSTVRYPGVIAGRSVDKETLRKVLKPTRDFQLAHNVRIYVGEFSAIRWAPGAAQYIDDLISLFEEYGWDWSYHAFREWEGWSVEHADLPYDRTTHPLAEKPTERQVVLQKWLSRNQRNETPVATAKP